MQNISHAKHPIYLKSVEQDFVQYNLIFLNPDLFLEILKVMKKKT